MPPDQRWSPEKSASQGKCVWMWYLLRNRRFSLFLINPAVSSHKTVTSLEKHTADKHEKFLTPLKDLPLWKICCSSALCPGFEMRLEFFLFFPFLFFSKTCPVRQLRHAVWKVRVPSGGKTDLLCEGKVLHTLPSVIFIEIYWQGHRRAPHGVDRKRDEREAGDDNRRGDHRKLLLLLLLLHCQH